MTAAAQLGPSSECPAPIRRAAARMWCCGGAIFSPTPHHRCCCCCWSRHITRHNGYNTATIPVSCFSLLRCCAVSLMQLLLSCALCAIWVWVWGFLNTGSAEDGAQKCGTKCQMRVIKRCFSCRQDTGLLEDFYSDKKRNMQEKKLVSIWRQNVAQCALHTPQYTTSLHSSYHNGNLGWYPLAFWWQKAGQN